MWILTDKAAENEMKNWEKEREIIIFQRFGKKKRKNKSLFFFLRNQLFSQFFALGWNIATKILHSETPS